MLSLVEFSIFLAPLHPLGFGQWTQISTADWQMAIDEVWTPYVWTDNTTRDFANWSYQVGTISRSVHTS